MAATKHANGNGNGKTSTSNGKAVVSEAARARDKLADTHSRFEFGGPLGVTAMMTGFPLMMYYFWICLWFNQGRLVLPATGDALGVRSLLAELGGHIMRDAFPSAWAFKVYLGLMAYELVLALILPGKTQKGLPVPSLGYKQLTYHCNALACWYVTLATSATLHVTGLFDLASVIDNFGPLMSVAIIVGFSVSTIVFIGSKAFHWGGKPLRLSGSFPYDFFMGSSLNPRIGSVDLKMWQEVRIPWVLLFHIAVSAAIKQFRVYGYLSPNMAFMVLATGLYINACAKGEECIPVSIDMIYEKDGFMLTFWNFAGVPFTYAYSIIYLHRTNPAVYAFSWPATVGLYSLLLTSYWIFDTANSQKAIFRLEDAGGYVPRKAFPQLPWRRVDNPTFIETAHGSKLLTSGWYKFCVKPHYLADFVQSFSWGLCTGFSTPIAYFYPMWFITVLIHRCGRDFEKCEEKYGEDWKRYLKVVKYKFIPGVY